MTTSNPDEGLTVSPFERPVLGIVGGGQVGRTLLRAAAPLGLDVRVLAEPSHAPATSSDATTIAEFAATVDVLTFDHQHVLPAVLAALDTTAATTRPSTATLRTIGDKLALRRRLLGERLAVIPGVEATDTGELHDVLRIFPPPVVLRSRQGAFDGQGERFVPSHHAAELAAAALGWPVLVEPLLNHQGELAVLVARRPGGESRAYPVIRTRQVDGRCRIAETPSGLAAEAEREAQAIAVRVAEVLDTVGIVAVSLLVVEGVLAVDDVAACPHHSGDLTVDACSTSQFENHLRAVLDWPLGATDLTVRAATMVEVPAVDATARTPAQVPEVLRAPGVRVHLYEEGLQAGDKIGHVTAVGDDTTSTRAAALTAARALARGTGHPMIEYSRFA